MRLFTKKIKNTVRHSYYVSFLLWRANRLQNKADQIVESRFLS